MFGKIPNAIFQLGRSYLPFSSFFISILFLPGYKSQVQKLVRYKQGYLQQYDYLIKITRKYKRFALTFRKSDVLTEGQRKKNFKDKFITSSTVSFWIKIKKVHYSNKLHSIPYVYIILSVLFYYFFPNIKLLARTPKLLNLLLHLSLLSILNLFTRVGQS